MKEVDLTSPQPNAPRVTGLSGRGANLGTRVCNPRRISVSYARRRSVSVRTSWASVNSPHHPAHVFSAISTSCSWHYWLLSYHCRMKMIVNAWDIGLHGSTGVAASLGQFRPQQLQHASNHWHILRRHEIPKQGPGAELSRIAALVWVRLGRTSPVRLLLGHATWKWHWCGYMQETHGLLADLFSTECRFHWFMANFTLNPGWFLDMLVIGLSWNVS